MTFGWLQEAIKQKEEPGLNKENLRHFKMASPYSTGPIKMLCENCLEAENQFMSTRFNEFN